MSEFGQHELLHCQPDCRFGSRQRDDDASGDEEASGRGDASASDEDAPGDEQGESTVAVS